MMRMYIVAARELPMPPIQRSQILKRRGRAYHRLPTSRITR